MTKSEEKIYSQMRYTAGYQKLVRAHSPEEAQQKFKLDHEDVIHDEELDYDVDIDDSEVVEQEDLEVGEIYDGR